MVHIHAKQRSMLVAANRIGKYLIIPPSIVETACTDWLMVVKRKDRARLAAPLN